mgnify:CR=1 FL=1
MFDLEYIEQYYITKGNWLLAKEDNLSLLEVLNFMYLVSNLASSTYRLSVSDPPGELFSNWVNQESFYGYDLKNLLINVSTFGSINRPNVLARRYLVADGPADHLIEINNKTTRGVAYTQIDVPSLMETALKMTKRFFKSLETDEVSSCLVLANFNNNVPEGLELADC